MKSIRQALINSFSNSYSSYSDIERTCSTITSLGSKASPLMVMQRMAQVVKANVQSESVCGDLLEATSTFIDAYQVREWLDNPSNHVEEVNLMVEDSGLGIMLAWMIGDNGDLAQQDHFATELYSRLFNIAKNRAANDPIEYHCGNALGRSVSLYISNTPSDSRSAFSIYIGEDSVLTCQISRYDGNYELVGVLVKDYVASNEDVIISLDAIIDDVDDSTVSNMMIQDILGQCSFTGALSYDVFTRSLGAYGSCSAKDYFIGALASVTQFTPATFLTLLSEYLRANTEGVEVDDETVSYTPRADPAYCTNVIGVVVAALITVVVTVLSVVFSVVGTIISVVGSLLSSIFSMFFDNAVQTEAKINPDGYSQIMPVWNKPTDGLRQGLNLLPIIINNPTLKGSYEAYKGFGLLHPKVPTFARAICEDGSGRFFMQDMITCWPIIEAFVAGNHGPISFQYKRDGADTLGGPWGLHARYTYGLTPLGDLTAFNNFQYDMTENWNIYDDDTYAASLLLGYLLAITFNPMYDPYDVYWGAVTDEFATSSDSVYFIQGDGVNVDTITKIITEPSSVVAALRGESADVSATAMRRLLHFSLMSLWLLNDGAGTNLMSVEIAGTDLLAKAKEVIRSWGSRKWDKLTDIYNVGSLIASPMKSLSPPIISNALYNVMSPYNDSYNDAFAPGLLFNDSMLWPEVSKSSLISSSVVTALSVATIGLVSWRFSAWRKRRSLSKLSLSQKKFDEATAAYQRDPTPSNAKALYKANKGLTRAWNRAGRSGLASVNGFSTNSKMGVSSNYSSNGEITAVGKLVNSDFVQGVIKQDVPDYSVDFDRITALISGV